MVSMKLLYCTLLASVALAQSTDEVTSPPNATFSDEDVQRILQDSEVDGAERESWCTGQTTNCDILCGGGAEADSNLCDSSTLDYECTCASNSSSPALEFYQNTIPYYECRYLNDRCVADNAGRLAAQRACNTTYVCGTVDVNQATNDSDDSSSDDSSNSEDSGSSESASPTDDSSTTETSPPATEESEGAAFALRVGQQYGVGILGAGLFAAMTILF